MLKKINRLSKDKEFGEVKREKKMLQSPLFGVLWTKKPFGTSTNSVPPFPSQGTTKNDNKKVAFVVSKRISKKAVERNRIRRLLSEVVRRNMDELPSGFRGIFLVTKQMLGRTYKEVDDNWRRMVKLIK